jgi:hypothetical protein
MMMQRYVNTRLLRIAQCLAGCRRGVAMFEFAIALPLLLIIFAGAWEMARGLWTYDILNKGVRDAARYLARVDNPAAPANQDMALRLVLSGDIDAGPGGQPPRIDHNLVNVTMGTRSFANSGGLYRSSAGQTGPIEVVQVRADMTFEAPLLEFLSIANPIVFSVAHEERHIGD